MSSRAVTSIEEYMNTERHKVLLDVAKHALAGLLTNSGSDGTYESFAKAAANHAEALIGEVESR